LILQNWRTYSLKFQISNDWSFRYRRTWLCVQFVIEGSLKVVFRQSTDEVKVVNARKSTSERISNAVKLLEKDLILIPWLSHLDLAHVPRTALIYIYISRCSRILSIALDYEAQRIGNVLTQLLKPLKSHCNRKEIQRLDYWIRKKFSWKVSHRNSNPDWISITSQTLMKFIALLFSL
jgi:hypothetical protein